MTSRKNGTQRFLEDVERVEETEEYLLMTPQERKDERVIVRESRPKSKEYELLVVNPKKKGGFYNRRVAMFGLSKKRALALAKFRAKRQRAKGINSSVYLERDNGK